MKVIEVRCKGTFGYLRGNKGRRTLAVPEANGEEPQHECHLFVRKNWVSRKDRGHFDNEIPKKLYGELGKFIRFTQPLSRVRIDGQRYAPAKDGASSPIPSNGYPNGDPELDTSWTSAGFIPSFRRLNLPEDEPVADVTRAPFTMSLPPLTQWYGLRPWQKPERLYIWRFPRPFEIGQDVIPAQAITDVVGFQLAVPGTMTITLFPQYGRKQQLKLKFGRRKYLTGASGFPLAFISAPPQPHDKSHGKPKAEDQAQHFRQLYNLFPSEFEGRPDKFILPILRKPVGELADDIFCPGGEGEGGG